MAPDSGTATRSGFGELADGRPVDAVVLSNSRGIAARVIAYGAILQLLKVPDRDGISADVVLGFDDVKSYVDKSPYFGASIGRYANRIADGQFTLDGKTYVLAKNDGPNSLHGGASGFDKKLWQIVDVQGGSAPSVTLTCTSPDGEEGYPGTLQVTATYALHEDELHVTYQATTDQSTIVNLANHSYFNLGGAMSAHAILDAMLTIPANETTPVNATLIPNGRFAPVDGTPFDFRSPARIGARIRDGRDAQLMFGRGYDHNFAVARSPTADLHLLARLEDQRTGRAMELLGNQPGVQFYSGNYLDGTLVGKGGRVYRQSDGLCLEPQLFPDTPNQPAFGSARLDPGQTYVNRIVYRFSISR